MVSGDPNCCLCRAQSQNRWSSLPQIRAHGENGCPYCQNMLEGLIYLIPDVEKRFGNDAQFRFTNRRDMKVYRGANGPLGNPPPYKAIHLQYRWFMVDQPQPYELPGDTASDHSFSTAQSWIQDCVANHKLCGPDEPSPLPTRILHLGETTNETAEGNGDDLQIRLIEPSSDQRERYISLSHSWGCEQPLITTTATLEQHKTGIPLSQLPATFRDAVLICRKLGIHYLWIDSLCIIQDSDVDWQQEASRMASVYRNSYLTVYATASSSPSSGIFRSKQAVWIAADDPEDPTTDILFPAAAQLRQDLRLSLRFTTVHPDLSPRSDPLDQLDSLALLTRAWAYQERLLAPRVLHFGPHELVWECMQSLDCECGEMRSQRETQHMGTYGKTKTTGRLPPKISHYAALHIGTLANPSRTKEREEQRKKKLLARWEEMVEEYSRRSLTFSADRLPAFSGVAAEMVEALGMRYCAGLWDETFPAALLYERQKPSRMARLSIRETRPAPSWSWASIDAPVHFSVPLAGCPETDNPVVHARVVDIRCVPEGKDERGRVVRGESFMMLEVGMVRVELCFKRTLYSRAECVRDAAAKGVKGPVREKLGMGSFVVQVGMEEAVSCVLDVNLCDERGEWLWDGKDEIFCGKIMESREAFRWLVLRRLNQGGSDYVYERIGVLSNSYADWKVEGGRQTIKLV